MGVGGGQRVRGEFTLPHTLMGGLGHRLLTGWQPLHHHASVRGFSPDSDRRLGGHTKTKNEYAFILTIWNIFT
jgi:hypothetical protein